jgi:hypothetical protein
MGIDHRASIIQDKDIAQLNKAAQQGPEDIAKAGKRVISIKC